MSTVTLLIVIVVVVVVVAVLAVAASVMLRKRRSERLREEFGPEYERTLRESDDPNAAEADLRRREKQRQKIQLRDLDERERTEYRQRWDTIQGGFVDDPGRAVEQADRLVVDVMSARGYPAEDVDRRADDLSVDFPVITQRYREAREVSRRHEAGSADTEDLRGAVTSYRALVHALLDDGGSGGFGDAGDGSVRDGSVRDGSVRDGSVRHGDGRSERNGVLPGDDRRELPRDDWHEERTAGRGRGRVDDDRDDRPPREGDPVRDDRSRSDGDTVRDDRVHDDRLGDRDHLDDRDRGRDRVDDPDGDRDGRRVRDVVRDKVSGRDDGHPDMTDGRDGDGLSDRRPDAGHDTANDGDGDGDGRRLRDVLRDKVTGNGSEPDSRGSDGSGNGQAWERGRHAYRTEDDPRRETTT